MAITLTSDYIGEYKINKSCFDDLQLFIDKYEPFYLKRLLGANLYTLFTDDLTVNNPQTPNTTPYTDIFNDFCIDDGSCLFISDGIKKMLIQFIYYHYITEQPYKNTQSGMVTPDAENSNVTRVGFNDIKAYNEGISNYQIIQWYICNNSLNSSILDDNYNGIHLEFSSGI